MTLLDVEELTAYWAEHPPVHTLVAAYLGLSKKPRSSSGNSGTAGSGSGEPAGPDVGVTLADLGPGFGSGDIHAGLAPVVLDFTELRRGAAAVID